MVTDQDVSSGVVRRGRCIGGQEDFVGAPEDRLESRAGILVNGDAILEHIKQVPVVRGKFLISLSKVCGLRLDIQLF